MRLTTDAFLEGRGFRRWFGLHFLRFLAPKRHDAIIENADDPTADNTQLNNQFDALQADIQYLTLFVSNSGSLLSPEQYASLNEIKRKIQGALLYSDIARERIAHKIFRTKMKRIEYNNLIGSIKVDEKGNKILDKWGGWQYENGALGDLYSRLKTSFEDVRSQLQQYSFNAQAGATLAPGVRVRPGGEGAEPSSPINGRSPVAENLGFPLGDLRSEAELRKETSRAAFLQEVTRLFAESKSPSEREAVTGFLSMYKELKEAQRHAQSDGTQLNIEQEVQLGLYDLIVKSENWFKQQETNASSESAKEEIRKHAKKANAAYVSIGGFLVKAMDPTSPSGSASDPVGAASGGGRKRNK